MKKDEFMALVVIPILIALCVFFALGGLTACRGPQGDQGNTGASGSQGQQGVAGVNGSNGTDGVNGTNDTNATPVTVVQFCPNVTPSYPSTFPEYGICLQGQLYGVYSANDGFLALLPPGVYSSNAVGSSCTFTILANCVVTQ